MHYTSYDGRGEGQPGADMRDIYNMTTDEIIEYLNDNNMPEGERVVIVKDVKREAKASQEHP